MVRNFELTAYLHQGLCVEFVLDASPWGIGGILSLDNKVSEYFHEEITQEVAGILDAKVGACESQQCFEALACMVALRVWANKWQNRRCTIMVRSDSISALILVLQFRTSGEGTTTIAKELALDISRGIYRPQLAQHVPGIANKAADALSRLNDPNQVYEIPECLAKVPRRRYRLSAECFYSLQWEKANIRAP